MSKAALPGPVPITLAPATASQLLTPGPCFLRGYNFREQTGTAPVEVWLVDGADATGLQIVAEVVGTNTSRTVTIDQPGVYIQQGLFLRIVSGACWASVWVDWE